MISWNRSFLELPKEIEFKKGWINLIIRCITYKTHFIIMNIKSYYMVKPKCKFRQYDSLSPYLFIICAKGLSCMIRWQKRTGVFKELMCQEIAYSSVTFVFLLVMTSILHGLHKQNVNPYIIS